MQKLIFYGCIALGAGIGVLLGADQGSWGLAVLFGLRLALVGLALAACSLFSEASRWGEPRAGRGMEASRAFHPGWIREH